MSQGPDELLAPQPALPFLERPWLVVHSVALAIAIAGALVQRTLQRQPLGTEEVGGMAVAMFLSMAALVAPGLVLRAGRRAMRRLQPPQRRVVLIRMWLIAVLGPATAWLLWQTLGGNGWWWQSAGGEVTMMMAMSTMLGLSAAAGLAMRYRGRLS